MHIPHGSTGRALAVALLLLLTLTRSTTQARPRQKFVYRAGVYEQVHDARPTGDSIRPPDCPLLDFPDTWDIFDAFYTDLTGDAIPECVLLVWRPWQDWPIMRWVEGPSPIAANRDADGYSAHIILVTPTERGYRELWAGSALADPLLAIAAADVNGDGLVELIALEGDYETGRNGPAHHITVWRWNDFGFTLQWRSPLGRFNGLHLYTLENHALPCICGF